MGVNMKVDGRSDYARIVGQGRAQIHSTMPLRALGYGLLFALPLWAIIVAVALHFSPF